MDVNEAIETFWRFTITPDKSPAGVAGDILRHHANLWEPFAKIGLVLLLTKARDAEGAKQWVKEFEDGEHQPRHYWADPDQPSEAGVEQADD